MIKTLEYIVKDISKYNNIENENTFKKIIKEIWGINNNSSKYQHFGIELYTIEQCLEFLIEFYSKYDKKKDEEQVTGGSKINRIYDNGK